MSEISRRTFCSIVAMTALGCTSVPRYLLKKDETWRIPISELDAQGRIVAIRPDQDAVLIMKTEQGFKGLLLKCTHRGCGLQTRKSDLVCPCHGSRFDLTGAVLEGPAQLPLTHIQVAQRDQYLIFV